MKSRRYSWKSACVVALLLLSTACARVQRQDTPIEPAGIAATPGPCLDVDPDSDRDGLADGCELTLVRAFAPLLMAHSTRCTLPTAYGDGRIAGGYFHAAQPVQGVVRLVYMPAYYRDCGWRGFKCVFVDCRGHAGDSEVIVVDVRRNQAGAWFSDAIFLSAHCHARAAGDCRWYRGDELDEFDWVDGNERGAPVVWVADARNANYPSRASCERGHWWLDSCDASPQPYRFPVAPERNIGSRAVPIIDGSHPPGCVSGRFVEPADRMIVAADEVECFWNESVPFGGWQASGYGATPYAKYLELFGL